MQECTHEDSAKYNIERGLLRLKKKANLSDAASCLKKQLEKLAIFKS